MNAQTDSSGNRMRFDLGITRGKNVYLWPILKKVKEGSVKDIQVAFTLYQYKRNYADTSRHSHLLPLIWKDSNTSIRDLRLLSLYYPSVFRFHNDFRSGIKTFSFIELAPDISLLSYSRSKDGNYLKNNFLPILWYKNNRLTHYNYLVAFPLYWHYSNPKGKSSTLFPLYSYGSFNRQQYRYTAITPLYWHVNYGRDGYKTNIYPLYFHRIFSSDSNNTGRQTTILPLYHSYSDRYYTSRVIFPLVWRYKNPDYHSFTLFPLYHNKASIDGRRIYRLVTPLYGYVKTPASETRWLAPFWEQHVSYRHKQMYRSTWVFPWYKSVVSMHDTRRTFFPVYWRYTDSTDRNLVLFPVLWSFKHKTENSFVLFPLLWQYDTRRMSSFSFMPFFASGHRKDSTRSFYAITPLYWHININKPNTRGSSDMLMLIWWRKRIISYEAPKSYNVIFPLWWHYTDSSVQRNSKVFFPFIWNLNSRNYHTFAFMPFYSKGYSKSDPAEKHFAITPFYWHFEDRWDRKDYIYPIWWHKTNKNKTTNIIFPLWWSRTKYTYSGEYFRVLFPVYWNYGKQNESKKLILPVLWRYKRSGDTNTVVFPLAYHFKSSSRKTSLFIPLYFLNHNYGARSVTTAITPLYWHTRNTSGSRDIFLPLYFRKRSGEYHNTVLFPLFYHYQNSAYRSFTFAPLFSYGRSRDNSSNKHLVITPLFWNIHKNRYHKVHLFPIVQYGSDYAEQKHFSILYILYRQKWAPGEKDISFLWPICRYQKNNAGHYFHLAPFIWYKRSKTLSYTAFMPFVFHRKDGDNRQLNILWQLYARTTRGEHTKKQSFLFKTVIANRYANNDYEYRLLYALYAKVKKQGRTESGIFPIYRVVRDSATGNYNKSVLLSLYSKFRKAIPGTTYSYEEEKILWFIRIRSNYQFLKSKGIISTRRF